MICNFCKIDKPSSEFKSYNGRKCNECKRQQVRTFQREHPEKKDAAKRSEYYKNWYAKNGRVRSAEKRRAHSAVFNAIRDGILVRPNKCSNLACDRTERIEAHHFDYSQPLIVMWLCNRCHRSLHTGH